MEAYEIAYFGTAKWRDPKGMWWGLYLAMSEWNEHFRHKFIVPRESLGDSVAAEVKGVDLAIAKRPSAYISVVGSTTDDRSDTNAWTCFFPDHPTNVFIAVESTKVEQMLRDYETEDSVRAMYWRSVWLHEWGHAVLGIHGHCQGGWKLMDDSLSTGHMIGNRWVTDLRSMGDYYCRIRRGIEAAPCQGEPLSTPLR